MKVPGCVLWHLTKKHSAFVVQPKGAKSRSEQFSKDPLNLTGLHNASQQGYTAEEAVGVTAVKGESEKKKDYRKVFYLHQTKDGAKLNHSSKKIDKGALKAVKYVKKLNYINDKKKELHDKKRYEQLNKNFN